MMYWPEYVKWFKSHYDVLKVELLESGCIEVGPKLEPTTIKFRNTAPFRSDWAVIYPDGNYFRVKEAFNRMAHPDRGAGRREHFSYHYGKAHASVDAYGFPITNGPDVPYADLRIDLDQSLSPHIHLGSPEHLTQDRIEGYSIIDADLFQFLEQVVAHRKGNGLLHELLGIKVHP